MGDYAYFSAYGAFRTDSLQDYERLKAEIEEKRKRELGIMWGVLAALILGPVVVTAGLFGWLVLLSLVVA
jgi:hypothetical protein